jgi:hypothetical protein
MARNKSDAVQKREDYIKEQLVATNGHFSAYQLMQVFEIAHPTACLQIRKLAKELGIKAEGVGTIPEGLDREEVKAYRPKKEKRIAEEIEKAKDAPVPKKAKKDEGIKHKCHVNVDGHKMWIAVRAKDYEEAKEKALEQTKGQGIILEVLTHAEHNDKYRRSSVYTSRSFI